ncbi:hypothetical protein tloyanaT_23690 [Thalassotalea loyana]|uniref:RidA family protein n=1 Tax=Thalassotalea loyana TaxID=280483 RepID=A0ABQ6HGX1_9GAMM|nr:Rid family detoxifying hydrolase [Thalassotalea loyana]GLX86116.1 hypothetical protein tloyanaT_23690 [Thalassotalea loyana]
MKHVLYSIITTLVVCISFASGAESEIKSHVEFLNSKPANKKLPFSEAVRVGDTVYLSGQIGIDPKTGKLAVGGFKAETRQTLENIRATLNKYGYQTKDVVKCLVMLTDINDFAAFNEIYTEFFKPPYPARSAFATSQLALGSLVEIECIAIDKSQ